MLAKVYIVLRILYLMAILAILTRTVLATAILTRTFLTTAVLAILAILTTAFFAVLTTTVLTASSRLLGARAVHILYIYIYFGPRTFLPRNFLEVLGISPLAFNDAVAVNPIDIPFFKRRNKFLFFLVAL
jgi:hypothetical protein